MSCYYCRHNYDRSQLRLCHNKKNLQCVNCQTIRDKLISHESHPNFLSDRILITYNVDEEVHDDSMPPWAKKTIYRKSTSEFPLLKIFTEDDIIEDKGTLTVDRSNPKLLYYKFEDYCHRSEYCELKTVYRIIDAKIIRKSTSM